MSAGRRIPVLHRQGMDCPGRRKPESYWRIQFCSRVFAEQYKEVKEVHHERNKKRANKTGIPAGNRRRAARWWRMGASQGIAFLADGILYLGITVSLKNKVYPRLFEKTNGDIFIIPAKTRVDFWNSIYFSGKHLFCPLHSQINRYVFKYVFRKTGLVLI